MTAHTLTLTIDGQTVCCRAGSTVYEAATAAGIHIPTFCHHPKLTPVGACRVCMVEIDGVRGLQTSCTTPAREGMVVRVHTSPAAVKQRRAVIEFLLTNHPLDCPVCDKGGECPLQDQAMRDGPGQSRYAEEKRQKDKRYPLGELIVLDQERCVLCWRCIRFLDEWADDHELDLFGRGAATRLDTFPGRPLRSKWQGNTIDVCPVGALTSRVFRFEARVWELTNTPSVCPLCSVGCNIVLGVKNNRVRRIVPRDNPEVNDVWLCDKGRFGHGFVDHPDRLTTPLIRRSGALQPARWEEALDLVARRFKGIVQEEGPQAIAGLGSTRVTNEANYLFQRCLRTAVGSNNVDHLGRVPPTSAPLGSLADLENRDLIVLLGLDPSTEAPLIELWIKKAILRHGAQAIVVHPRRIELSRYGGPWLGCRPGGEGALLNGLARAALDAGLAGPRGIRATNMDEFRAWIKEYTPDAVERVTGGGHGGGGHGGPPLQRAGQLLAGARRPIFLVGPNWGRRVADRSAPWPSREGLGRGGLSSAPPQAQAQAGVANLALLLGGAEIAFVAEDNNSWGALEMGVVPDLFPGRQPVSDNKVRSRLAGLWGSKVSALAGLDFDGMMAAIGESTLKALWIMGADPAAECRTAGEALGRLPFLVVQDLFLTETASIAEVVLPAASFAETDGTFVNVTGRLQAIRAARRPPGQARPDWWIVAEVARRLLPSDGGRQKAWEFNSAAEVWDEIAKAVPGYHGASRLTTALGSAGWQPPAAAAATPRAFVRVPSEPGVQVAWAGDLAQSEGVRADADYPLVLVSGRLLYDRGTLMARSGRPARLAPGAFVLVHPADAARLGLADGDACSVISPVGRLELAVQVSDEIVPGVAFAPQNLSAAPLSVLFLDRWTWPRVRIRK